MMKMELTVTMIVLMVSLISATARFPRTDDENESNRGKESHEIWKDARKEFKSAIKPTGGKVSFKDTVDKLAPFINSDLTESDCKTLCIEKLGSLLEQSVPDKDAACDSLCRAALSKQDKVES
ncbi:uncharacterized protein LOC112565252 isoform X2 [Pomacea canaliculata]|uniref:uncharacterized protein LOC112565252 isoform X1 n=1 Tax=Pomacea canaliculata TaxID=400727 RepID=UPI000D72F822|nr:uncharacterized protein LOC112565252 isoform X1 [Pomacea canaliculata]XP_025096401.1 uncharacterized protein LOC112565252 isoform X2 [Pomacea canaliculata]